MPSSARARTPAAGQRGRVWCVGQASMSAASILSMGFAGIVGDVIGVREVFFLAGAITGIGFVIAVVGYRGRESATAVAAGSGSGAGAGAGAPAG